jgi:hypothetical protein
VNAGKLANGPQGSRRLLAAAIAAAWLLAVLAPPAALAWWRAGRLAQLADPAVQAEWDAFRDAMRRESDRSGPVQRKVPKSAEPPELVWLRDYFWLAVAAWVVLGGTLGGFLAVVVLGVAGLSAQDQPGREGDDEEQDQRDRQNAEQR